MSQGAFSQLPVRRVQRREPDPGNPSAWPRTLPVARQLLAEGLDLGPITVLVGENGSGKSTLVEALAIAFGLSREGGTTHARHTTRSTESNLHESLQLVRSAGGSRWGFFMRAETMHGLYTYLENLGGSPGSGLPRDVPWRVVPVGAGTPVRRPWLLRPG